MKNCFFCHDEDCPHSGIDGCWGEDCLDINDDSIQLEDIEDCEDMEDEGC